MSQIIISGAGSTGKLEEVLLQTGIKKFLLVCDSSYPFLSIKKTVESVKVPFVSFSDFASNPLYESVCKGIELFKSEGCDAIVAVGGGSSIDVAKCIKLYCKMDKKELYLKQEYTDTGIPLIAIPTTAGTGSESTRFAVIYYNREKQSVAHESIIPNYVILDPDCLKTLPVYQKKCTLLDALCQAIESMWSVNSTEESREYAEMAIKSIMRTYLLYVDGTSDDATEKIQIAANYAGQAINITQTTAAHAMSYKLTSIYNLPHGHAVAVCLPKVWRYMLSHSGDCIDSRGEKYLNDTFSKIAQSFGVKTPEEAVTEFENILTQLGISNPETNNADDIEVLSDSVNPVRLKNNPVALSRDVLREFYLHIVKIEK